MLPCKSVGKTLPAGHVVQLVEFEVAAKDPGKQSTGAKAPASHNVPGGQGMHSSTLYVAGSVGS